MQLPIYTLGGLAQYHPGPHGPGPHGPHWGAGPAGGMGPGLGMGGGWLVLLLVLALLVVGVVAAALYLRSGTGDADRTADDALATLRERYASGDLDDDEFERRRERLTGRTG